MSRDYALFELDRRTLPGWPSGLVRRRVAEPADPRDRALAEQIIVGVIKNLLLLQHLVSHYSGRSLKSVDPLVQKILAIALYQMRHLDRVPDAAAVDEAVEQTRRFGRGRAAKFVNAVLRNATREPSPPLPDEGDPARYAQIVLSHPAGLFRRLEKLAGTETALAICRHDNREAPTIVRAASPPPADAGVAVEAHEMPGMYVVRGAKASLLAQWAQQGIAQVQDPTAARVVHRAGLQAGQAVLDRCCGLGTKTLQMREQVGEGGYVVAMDPNAARIDGLRRMMAARGFANIAVHQAGMMEELPADARRQFDRVIVDAPCSNSGVMARRPEARYAQSERALTALAKLQDRILDDSADAIAPGGLLIYSTCSIWLEENQQRVQAFLSRHGGFELVEEDSVLPSADVPDTAYHDGGYVAVLRRVE